MSRSNGTLTQEGADARQAVLSPVVSVDEAAELLGISRTMAYAWLEAQPPLIPHHKRGTRYVIFRADVQALAQGGTREHHGEEVEAAEGKPRWAELLAELEGRTLEVTIGGLPIQVRLLPAGERR